jgi:hypothetical protein
MAAAAADARERVRETRKGPTKTGTRAAVAFRHTERERAKV